MFENLKSNKKNVAFYFSLFFLLTIFILFVLILIFQETNKGNVDAVTPWIIVTTVLLGVSFSLYYNFKTRENFETSSFLFISFVLFSILTIIFALLWLILFLISKYGFNSSNFDIILFENLFKNTFITVIVIASLFLITQILIKLWYGEPLIDTEKIKNNINNSKKRKEYLKKQKEEQNKKLKNLETKDE